MGFGFVTFWRRRGADNALKLLQHSRLDTHSLELKRSNRAAERDKSEKTKGRTSAADGGKPSTKILVRNIPFQATKQEVTEIFKTFGELTAVRLPSKISGTGSHRGFAFVEFATKEGYKINCEWCWQYLTTLSLV
jgi:multiple RNA-binding domain-containing protein 1